MDPCAVTGFEFHWIAERTPRRPQRRRPILQRHVRPPPVLFMPVPTAHRPMARNHALWQTLRTETVSNPPQTMAHLNLRQPKRSARTSPNQPRGRRTHGHRSRATVPYTHTPNPRVPYTCTMINAAPNGGTSYPIMLARLPPSSKKKSRPGPHQRLETPFPEPNPCPILRPPPNPVKPLSRY